MGIGFEKEQIGHIQVLPCGLATGDDVIGLMLRGEALLGGHPEAGTGVPVRCGLTECR